MSNPNSDISFSFLFFSDVQSNISDQEKYEFMRKLVLFADASNFEAVYFPERHFYEFGSIYPNPALIASWMIPQTSRIRFRTAGISLPLHHPAEIAEWWAVNDVLSNGRVDLGFGSGWHKEDFILSPNTFHNRKEILADQINNVRKLWRGEEVAFEGPDEEQLSVRIYPRPVQEELNVWLLVTQNDEAFRFAGSAGYNVFTMLYGYGFEELEKKITIYREARKKAGFDPETGVISLMLHTLIMEDSDSVRRAVEAPFRNYIKVSLDAHLRDKYNEKEKETILEYSFQRYYKTGALFGTERECHSMIESALSAGVNEIACLVDFGVDYDVVKSSLPILKRFVSNYEKRSVSERLDRV